MAWPIWGCHFGCPPKYGCHTPWGYIPSLLPEDKGLNLFLHEYQDAALAPTNKLNGVRFCKWNFTKQLSLFFLLQLLRWIGLPSYHPVKAPAFLMKQHNNVYQQITGKTGYGRCGQFPAAQVQFHIPWWEAYSKARDPDLIFQQGHHWQACHNSVAVPIKDSLGK